MRNDPITHPRDLSGYSVRGPRIRIAHTESTALAGGSLYLQQVDPWLGYLLGRELTQREFTPEQGVYGEPSKPDGLLLPDGATHFITRDHVNSCAACHNSPYRDAGAGLTIPRHGGTGRNTPHLFGAGLIEMLGAELRLAALAAADDDRNGWIDLKEAKDKRFVYQTVPAEYTEKIGSSGKIPKLQGGELDFGRFDDFNLDGRPDLNPVFHVLYVDARGDRIPWATKLTDAGVLGYRLEVQVFGAGRLRVGSRLPEPSTLRGFTAQAFDIHQGLQPYDPITLEERHHSGESQVSNAGCLQFISAAGRDRGRVLKHDRSLDDPDRDGVPHEITAGDLDLVEWYLLNHPQPARGRITPAVKRGEALFVEIGCAACHTPDWWLPAENHAAADYTQRSCGDRRWFDLTAAYNAKTDRLEGKLTRLDRREGDRQLPQHGACNVRGLYSDLRYHDLGEAFHQVQFDGTVVTHFRTAPLWGVASSAPYGHDGADLDLRSSIVRHGGEAAESQAAFRRLPERDQAAVLAFLGSLVLYQTDQLPCDVNGDGVISEAFVVAGRNVGRETFRPEWLLRTPCRIEGPVTNLQGRLINSLAVENIREAYGLDLDYLRDADGDTWPDQIPPFQPREPDTPP